jgi:transmembrane sensor
VTGLILAEDEKTDAVLEEAMGWLLRLQDARNDPEIVRQFEIWLSRSASHARAWAKARRTWQLMGNVPPAYEHLWSREMVHNGRLTRRPAARARHRGRKPWTAAAAAIAAVGIFLVAAGPSLMIRMQADYATATAQTKIVTLDDGTTVTLGADSAISSRLTARERRITLLSGEAFFDVKHENSRPFVVDADGVEVTDIGTAFNVQLSSVETTVELARGAVGVAYEHAGENENQSLAPGEMLVVDRRTGAMVKSTIAQDEIAAWRSGELFVNDVTIGSVVEQLQRYHSGWIKIPDSGLATQRVTGLYDLRDPDRALRALVQPYGGHVHSVSSYLRILTRY